MHPSADHNISEFVWLLMVNERVCQVLSVFFCTGTGLPGSQNFPAGLACRSQQSSDHDPPPLPFDTRRLHVLFFKTKILWGIIVKWKFGYVCVSPRAVLHFIKCCILQAVSSTLFHHFHFGSDFGRGVKSKIDLKFELPSEMIIFWRICRFAVVTGSD